MLRSSRWYHRELARQLQAWQHERAQLVSTICQLAAGRPEHAAPLPPITVETTQPDADDDADVDLVHPDFVYP